MPNSPPDFQALLDIRKILVSHRNLIDLFEGFRNFMNEHFGSRDIGVILFDPSAESTKNNVLVSYPAAFPIDLESTNSALSFWVWQNQVPIIIDDTEKETRFGDHAALLLARGIRSCVCFPLTTGQRQLGAFILWSEQPDAYSNFQMDIGSLIAAEIAIAVDNILHTAELAKVNESLRAEIEQRTRAEEALRESEKRYRDIVEMQSEMICRYLPDTTITFVNEAYCRYFGKTKDELIGTSFLLLIPEVSRQITKKHIESLLKNPRIEPNEHPVVSADGEIRWQQWIDSVVFDDEGEIKEIQAVGRDVTERKLAEDALQRTREQLAHVTRAKSMGELTASIAHEVNQPLTAIINNSNACLRWLASESPNLEEVREAMNDIIKDGNRASDVIARIRMLLKKKAFQPVPLDLNKVIKEVIILMRNECERKKILLRTELAMNLPEILGDRIELQQVVLNLIMNGIEAMGSLSDDRTLRITSRRENGEAIVTVCDNGEGFDQENANLIFEPFYTTKSHGLGIGLSISRSILEAHGGRLWATPNADHGSTFSFSVPEHFKADDIQDRPRR
jgi:PAS domain S-box-containing protein